MATVEFLPYIGAILSFSSYYMATMIHLRIAAILSSSCYLAYGLLEGFLPFILLNIAILPLNILRLHQMRRVIAQAKSDSSGGVSIEVLYPFMTPIRFRKDEVLFRKGQSSPEIFYIVDGAVRLNELGKTLGSGEMLGEISMFSPSRERTSTAVAVTDVNLMRMTRDQVLQLYHQNPRFGFYLIQLITGRLVENYAALEASIRGTGISKATPEDLPPLAKPQRSPYEASSTSSSGQKDFMRVFSLRLRWAALGLLLLIALFLGWNAAPYIRSVITRDAVVTTWINVATSPIRGTVVGPLPVPGKRLGDHGRIATVRDFRADESSAARSAAEVKRLEAEIAMLAAHISELERTDESVTARAQEYAEIFKEYLEIAVDGMRRELSSINDQLDLARAEAQRNSTLLDQGTGTASAADRAMAEVRELERVRSELEKELARTQQRHRAVEDGVFITSAGDYPDWAYDNRVSLHLEIERAKHAMAKMRTRLIEARAIDEMARELLKRRSVAEVTAPPGSLAWSVLVDAGATVAAGQPLLEWINCGVAFVDAPVSNMEVALLQRGATARVILEGERQVREGTVMLVRGSAATLDRAELAAVTKDRTAGDGQVLLSIDLGDLPGCPVGRKASVEFPEISMLDMLRSRLRL